MKKNMKEYCVTLPIAGHAIVTVEAESPEDAVNQALEVVTIDDIDEECRVSDGQHMVIPITKVKGKRHAQRSK